MPQIKKVIGLLVFTLLILIKVSGFHVYAHDHDDCESIENCEICDMALELQSADLQYSNEVVRTSNEIIIEKSLVARHDRIFTDKVKVYRLCSRPPPCS